MASSKSSKFGQSLNKAWNTTKEKASSAKKSMDQRLTMEGLLTQAAISLQQYLDPKIIKAEERMSQSVLRDAKGVVLITEAKGGFIVGVKGGTGVILVKQPPKKGIMKRLAKAQWSAPCAVGTGGISVGFLAGATKVDHIIVLSSQEQVEMFLSKGQLQIKGNTNVTAAKYGRNAEAGIGVGTNKTQGNKQAVAPFFTYSFGVKGVYGGISLDGEVLSVRKDCNHTFYQKEVTVKEILNGDVKMPGKNKDYQALIKLLNDFCNERNGGGKNSDTHDDDEKTNEQTQQQNQAAMQSVAENKQVQSATKSAMKDAEVKKAAYGAYKGGGNDPNANAKLAKSLAQNKQVQGAAVSVAKDKNVQKAALQTAKQSARKQLLSNKSTK